MKHKLIPLLTLTLLGALLFTGCEMRSSTAVTYPKNAAEYYRQENITLPDGFERPDLIWGSTPNPLDMGVSAPPGDKCIYVSFDVFSKYGADTRYAVTVDYAYTDELNTFHQQPVSYLKHIGWECIREASSEDIDSTPTAVFAATQAQIEALDPADMQIFYELDHPLSVDINLAVQSYPKGDSP